jgi:hypothetical protein
MATKPLFGAGTSHWPTPLSPHATIEPSSLSPRLWYEPAATATKPVFGAGGVSGP